VEGYEYTKLPRPKIVNRYHFLQDKSRDRSVLDVGFACHYLNAEDIDPARWMHYWLRQVARRIVALDINEQFVASVRKLHPDWECVVGNAENVGELPGFQGSFEIIIAGELVEHLSNPGNFIKSCRLCLADGGSLIISTPLPTTYWRTWLPTFGVEVVHHEHCMYHSYSTLRELLRRYDMQITEAAVFPSYGTVDRRYGGFTCQLIKRTLVRIEKCLSGVLCQLFPYWSAGIIIVAETMPESGDARRGRPTAGVG